jgi:6-phosphogluconolactonase
LTGGSSVGSVYERLADSELDWPNWHVWWSDERDVPPDDDRSNEKLAREKLLSRVSVPEDQIHPLRSTEVELPERFDLILLGIGPDGHAASPGGPSSRRPIRSSTFLRRAGNRTFPATRSRCRF